VSVATNRLDGKVAIVTGAGTTPPGVGIGCAIAQVLAGAGASVLLVDKDAEHGEVTRGVIEKDGGQSAVCVADVSVESDCEAMVRAAVDTFGGLDILINNAGIGNYKNLIDTSAEDYDALMNANMRSGFLFSRHAAPHMIAQHSGTILFISSIAGLQGAAGESVYCATKFAQIGFAQALDAELRKHNIKVGAICPGGVKSEFALHHGRTEDFIRNSHMMEPAEVAAAIVFACLQPPNLRIPQLTVRHMG
jgi:NAD(P)-dependent dehydrogenase (short-subunit alcohol dehydrogenase family)